MPQRPPQVAAVELFTDTLPSHHLSRTVVRRCRAGERARASPRGGRARAGAARRSEVQERRRPGPERRPLPALRRAARRPGVQAQHVPHHLDVVVPAGLHVPVEVHDSCALCLCIAASVCQEEELLVIQSVCKPHDGVTVRGDQSFGDVIEH